MSSRSIFRLVLLVALAPWPADAQVESPLTLRAAVGEAIASNPELLALRQEYEAARGLAAQEGFLSPPMLEAQIWGWPVTTLNPARTDMYMLTAEQELPGKGKRAARTLVVERDAALSAQQIAIRESEIRSDVRQAYIDLMFTRETFSVYAREVALLDDIAEAATLRYAAGDGAQHHTIVALVEVTAVEKARIAADERALAAEARLNTLLGRPPSRRVEPLAPVVAGVSPDDAELLALADHPQLGLVDAAVAREEAELARLRLERRPDYLIGGGYMLTPGDAGAWTVRGAITWPNAPWSRGRVDATVRAQEKRLEAAGARRAVVAAQLRQTVREALVRLQAAERQLRLVESTLLPQLEHAFALTRLAYASGEGPFTDMLDTRRTLLATQMEALEARAAVARARAELDSVAGAL